MKKISVDELLEFQRLYGYQEKTQKENFYKKMFQRESLWCRITEERQQEKQLLQCVKGAWADFANVIAMKAKQKFWNCQAWYVTMTFRNNVGFMSEASEKARRLFIHKLNRVCFGVRYWERGQGVISISGEEPQRRGVSHFHMAVFGIPHFRQGELIRRMDFVDWCYERFGRTRIYEYDFNQAKQNVLYLSKYIVKGGEIVIDGPVENLLFGAKQLLLFNVPLT